jgi:hypothetical protein
MGGTGEGGQIPWNIVVGIAGSLCVYFWNVQRVNGTGRDRDFQTIITENYIVGMVES